MILKNKLGIKSEIELAKEEERISKLKAKKLFENIYNFAAIVRDVNISKGNFRFAPI